MKDRGLLTPEQLGAAIRLKRKEKGLSQSALASLLGAERKWVVKLESGNYGAEIGLILKALSALDLRAYLEETTRPRTRGTLHNASPLQQVFDRVKRGAK